MASDDCKDEGPSDEDLEQFGGQTASTTMPCPECGAEIYDDAERCPVCGQYVTHRTSEWSPRPLWWVVLAVAGVAATICALACWALGPGGKGLYWPGAIF